MNTLHRQRRAALEAIAQPGTNVWAMTERFREELKKDTTAQSFNDDFADAVSQFMRSSRRRAWNGTLIACALSFLLATLLLGYEMPLILPYLPQSRTDGLVDITVVVLLIIAGSVIEMLHRSYLFRAILRVYTEERYGKAQEHFILLKWNVDLLFDDLGLGTYNRPWITVLNLLHVVGSAFNLVILIGIGMILSWGVWVVFWSPTFALVSIPIVILALCIFLYTLLVAILCRTQIVHEHICRARSYGRLVMWRRTIRMRLGNMIGGRMWR